MFAQASSFHHLPQLGCTDCVLVPLATAYLHALYLNCAFATLSSMLRETLHPHCRQMGLPWGLAGV